MSVWSALLHLTMAGRLKRFAADLRDPAAAQRRRLGIILERNAGTRFGREHGFAAVLAEPENRRWDHYRRAVPVRPYEGFAPWMEPMLDGEPDQLIPGRPTMFSTTSGTTSEPKHCPINRAFTVEHHNSHLLWMYHFQKDHPGVVPGRYLALVSPAESSRTPGGIPLGSMSGRQLLDQSIPIRRWQAVPYAVAGVKPHAAKLYAALLFALRGPVSIATAVNPLTLHLLARRLHKQAEELIDDLAAGRLDHAPGMDETDHAALAPLLKPRPKRAAALREKFRADGGLWARTAWPELAGVSTWLGGSVGYFAGLLREDWGEEVAYRCLGLRASEGNFSIPLRDNDPAAVFSLSGHAVEFLPEEDGEPGEFPATLLAHELREGRRYRIIATTSGGFHRYDLADVVEVAGFRDATPELIFIHRAGRWVSLVGEKVTEVHVVDAVRRALAASRRADGERLAGFTATATYGDIAAGRPPHYLLAVEWAAGVGGGDGAADLARRQRLAADFDRAMREVNLEYDERRASERLGPAVVRRLPAGRYDAFRDKLIALGRPDGQLKPPYLEAPEALWTPERRGLSFLFCSEAAADGPDTGPAQTPSAP